MKPKKDWEIPSWVVWASVIFCIVVAWGIDTPDQKKHERELITHHDTPV